MDRPEPLSAEPLPLTWKQRLLRLYCNLLVTAWLLVLYALSIGPMFWYWYDSKYLSDSPLLASFYAPLAWACEWEPLGKVVNWYIHLWIV